MVRDALTELRLRGAPTTEHIDIEALGAYRVADGGGFPSSYSAFVLRGERSFVMLGGDAHLADARRAGMSCRRHLAE
ncbi:MULTISPECIES: hypothetical protein [unclassified Streptomyces]|uniref:hypothetical protein n=1 Tax=unclassified Streptomyces TaxID=2593676 RepID=UPI003830F6A3